MLRRTVTFTVCAAAGLALTGWFAGPADAAADRFPSPTVHVLDTTGWRWRLTPHTSAWSRSESPYHTTLRLRYETFSWFRFNAECKAYNSACIVVYETGGNLGRDGFAPGWFDRNVHRVTVSSYHAGTGSARDVRRRSWRVDHALGYAVGVADRHTGRTSMNLAEVDRYPYPGAYGHKSVCRLYPYVGNSWVAGQ